MRQISKANEPNEFLLWKIANQEHLDELITNGSSGDEIWDILPSSLSREIILNDYCKSLLRESLSTEQYYICCYCNDRIKGNPLDTKIEHFLPKETYKSSAFDYQNLLAACNGGEREPLRPRILSCDSYKGSHDPQTRDIVSPFDNDISLHLGYRENGEIIGKTTKGINTINFFNLDCPRLVFRRKTAIEEYLYDESEDFESVIQDILAPKDGKLEAFCIAIVDVLEKYK